MKYGLICILLCCTLSSFEQVVNPDTVGSVIVYKDARIDVLAKQQLSKAKKPINHSVGIARVGGITRGYRVQVLNTNNRVLANKTKGDLYSRFPGQKVYIVYRSPFFKVRIGNFLKRNDAESFMRTLSSLFSSGIYVVPDLIEYRPSAKDKKNDDD